MKRALDFLVAAVGLAVLSPLFVLAAIFIKATSRGPVLFLQERMGRDFRPFFIYKFRTMIQDAPQKGGPITVGNDPRITSIGHLLRKTKIDELPQLLNVLKGDMSLVGPRPEVRKYVELYREDYAIILKVRPGITDLASLEYRDESALLATALDPDEAYRFQVLPEKLRLARQYLERSSLLFDLSIVLRTVFALVRDRFSRGKPMSGNGLGSQTKDSQAGMETPHESYRH